MYCELLNEQISAERYRTAGAGCGRGDNTPFIRDTALLSFRHSFALNVQARPPGGVGWAGPLMYKPEVRVFYHVLQHNLDF